MDQNVISTTATTTTTKVDCSCGPLGFHGNMSGLYAWLFLSGVALSVLLNLCLTALAVRQRFTNRQLKRQGQYQANPESAESGRFVFDNCCLDGNNSSQLLSVSKTVDGLGSGDQATSATVGSGGGASVAKATG